jgi:large subunit ribosomal protein L19
MTAEPERIKGVVIAKTRKGVASSFVLINVEAGTPVQRRIPLYSPLIQNIKVIQEAFIHKGKRRVRRSKLYYLWERDPDSYTVR